ncbi:MAG: hypothetical protein ACK4TN_07570, partial [Brevinematales bacterium]
MLWIQIFYTIVFPVLLIFGIGYLLGKIFHWHHQTLSTLSLYLLTPALIFQAIYSHPEVINLYFLRVLIVITLLVGISFGIIWFLSRFFHWEEGITRVVI